MKRNEAEFLEKMRLKASRKLKERQERGKKKVVIVVNASPEKEKIIVQKQYFTSYVLNKDPSCSKYMPFDEVYFPKLFNEKNAVVGPESIDNMWLLGFQDMETRKKAPPPPKAKAEVKI